MIVLLAAAGVRGAVEVTRSPAMISPAAGEPLAIELRLAVFGLEEAIVIEEAIPDGWRLLNASPPVDRQTGGRLLWLFTGTKGVASHTLSYQVIPSSATGTVIGIWKSIDTNGNRWTGSISPVGTAVSQPRPLLSECAPDERLCEGGSVVSCFRGLGWFVQQTCSAGCEAGACKPVPVPPAPEAPRVDLTGGFLSSYPSVIGATVMIIVLAVAAWGIRSWRRKPKQPFRYEFRSRG